MEESKIIQLTVLSDQNEEGEPKSDQEEEDSYSTYKEITAFCDKRALFLDKWFSS